VAGTKEHHKKKIKVLETKGTNKKKITPEKLPRIPKNEKVTKTVPQTQEALKNEWRWKDPSRWAWSLHLVQKKDVKQENA